MMTSSIECPLVEIRNLIDFVDGTFDRDFLVGQVNKTDDLARKNFAISQRGGDAAREAIGADDQNLDFISAALAKHFEKHADENACDGRENEESDRADSDHES